MTDERTRELMKAKGFRANGIDGRCYNKREAYSRELVCVDWYDDDDYRVRVTDQNRKGLRALVFRNPIAAATYAERHVIPALLAGKESR